MFDVSTTGSVVLLIVKLFYLLAIGLYGVFAFMMIRQVQQMTSTVRGVMNLPLQIMVWVHLLLVIGVFLITLLL